MTLYVICIVDSSLYSDIFKGLLINNLIILNLESHVMITSCIINVYVIMVMCNIHNTCIHTV